jgi:hypothetical protein
MALSAASERSTVFKPVTGGVYNVVEEEAFLVKTGVETPGT